MEPAHGVWVGSQYMTLPTQSIWRVEADLQCPSETRGRCYGGSGRACRGFFEKAAHRLGKAGEACIPNQAQEPGQ